MNYEFNIPKYIADLLPVLLRKPKTLEWLHCLIFPIDNLHSQEVVPFIDFVREELKFNSKTAVLEYYLRKNYAGNAASITIINLNNPEPDLFIGRLDDQTYEVFLGRTNEDIENVIVNRSGVQVSVVFDFDVVIKNSFVPSITEYILSKMVASINKYKTLGRSFRIVTESDIQLYPS
jgi:hypothetical protein